MARSNFFVPNDYLFEFVADPRRLQLAQDQGCRVVACHSGSGWNNDSPDYFSHFVDMARRNENLYGDTAVMATLTRARDLERARDSVDLQSRLVHGSDFPFPSWPIAFASTIGPNRALELQQESNLIRRDYELKEALGLGKATAERGYRLVFGVGRRGSPPGGGTAPRLILPWAGLEESVVQRPGMGCRQSRQGKQRPWTIKTRSGSTRRGPGSRDRGVGGFRSLWP